MNFPGLAQPAMSTADTIAKLLTEILEMQQKYLACQMLLQEEITRGAKLAEELSARGDWREESRKYELHELHTGVVVMKPTNAAGGPAHHLCPNCFINARFKSFLCLHNEMDVIRDCRRCGAHFWFGRASKTEGGATP